MILGTTQLEKKLDTMSKTDLKNGIGKGISLVQKAAKSKCPENHGELRNSIYIGMEIKGDVVRGTCFTNKEYAPYVEFGTGPIGQANHSGISPDAEVAYVQEPWWIHESQIDKSTVERYRFIEAETKEGTFYKTSGQAAQPFMYPALKDNEDEVVKIVASAVKEQL